jgi:hypothetical protein
VKSHPKNFAASKTPIATTIMPPKTDCDVAPQYFHLRPDCGKPRVQCRLKFGYLGQQFVFGREQLVLGHEPN